MPLTSQTLSGVSTFIFDLDGVIWRGESPVEGAAASVEQLKQLGKRCFYATNNSARSPQWFVDRLQSMGINAQLEEIVTSATATASFIARNFSTPSVYVVGEEGIQSLLRGIGAEVFTVDNVAPSEEIEVVVAGIDRTFNYEKLKWAQQFILRGAQFIATNRDATFPVEGGVVPGAGSIVAAIETASGIVPLSMGKPEPAMLLEILASYNLQPAEVAIIGDRLDTDIACGSRAGIGTVLVGTGVTSLETGLEATGEQKPDLLFADLPTMMGALVS